MRTVVAVLRGGVGNGYDMSLKTGAHMLEVLDKERYDARDIYIDRTGQWYSFGMPVTPERALRGIDAALVGMHGEYGEDGQVQRVLQNIGVPFAGSGSVPSALAFSKPQTKLAMRSLGLLTPRALVVERPSNIEELAFTIFRTFPQPSVIKPVRGGLSSGVVYVDSYPALVLGLEQAFAVAPKVLIEEYIRGKEATVGVIEGFRGDTLYSLPPVEIAFSDSRPIYDFAAKHGEGTHIRVPSGFSEQEKRLLEASAKALHQSLGLSHYSRSDFIVSKRGTYLLEANAYPDLAKHSTLSHALSAVGVKISDFVSHLLSLARVR